MKFRRVNKLFGSTVRRLGALASSGMATYHRVITGGPRFKREAKQYREMSELPPARQIRKNKSTNEQAENGVLRENVERRVVAASAPPVAVDEDIPPRPGKSRFVDFAIAPVVLRGLREQGLVYCTPIQEKALPSALAGKDLVARAQTGTGKTAVFMVAMLSGLSRKKGVKPRPGRPRALVMAPTRELVVQIVEDGKKIGAHSSLRLVAVYGGMDYKKQESLLRDHPIDIVVATPGRLLDFLRRKACSLADCSTLVIDEADRMLDMGFMPDMRRIVSQLPGAGKRQTMFFSATVNDDVRRLADQWCLAPEFTAAGEETIDVGKIEQRIYLTCEAEKFILLYNLIKQAKDGRILIFENMKSEALQLARRIERHGLSCQLLTGDVAQHKRQARLEDFRSGKNRILVATDVAGRGIHVDDIEYVINYSLPFEPENYVHRIGRTGRAGANGIAVSFACEKGSFHIPEIETFIDRRLECIMPEDELLAPVPDPAGGPRPAKRRHSKRRYQKKR